MSRTDLYTALKAAFGKAWRDRRYELWLIGLGLLASAPLLLYGFPHPTHDGFWHLRWWSNFSSQFWHGELYPRWLPETNFGCGSPTFFYYPPWPYWISSLFAPISGYAMPAWRALGWGAALSVVLSGLTAFWCLQKLASSTRACVGAALYMLMPYHLAIDILERGAYAESWAFAWMPVIFGGILELSEQRPHAWFKTAAGFALLFMTHLPTTVTFAPLALGFALCAGMRVLGLTIAALGAGTGLAAVYLVPALTTQASVSTQYLRFPYQTAFFFPTLEILKPLSRPDAFNVRLLWNFGLVGLTFFSFYGVLLAAKEPRALFRRTAPWLGLAFCTMLLMLPTTDPLYQLLPPLQMIQFPWRFLAPAMLWVAVLVTLFWPEPDAPIVPRLVHGAVLLAIIALIVPMTWSAYSRTCLASRVRYGLPPALFDPKGEDVHEYRPAQAKLEAARKVMGVAKCKVLSDDATVTVAAWRPRLIRLETQAATNAQVLVRQYYYPGWSASTSRGARLTLAADAATGLLSLSIPPGWQEITIRLLPGFAEKSGWAVTMATVLVCVGVYLGSRRNRQRQSCKPEVTSEEKAPDLASGSSDPSAVRQSAP